MDNTKIEKKSGHFRISSGLVIGLLIALCFALSLFIRVHYTYDQVFVGDWVKYTQNDAYYQMRVVDNMVYNFPHVTSWDPYIIYPDGNSLGGIHFFSMLLAFIIWILTLGSPTPHAVDVISVYFPVVLAALTVIPVYFIGKALFNRWAGVIAAGLMAIMPGEYLGRSILGCVDYHVAEILFITIALMFTIFAIKSASQNQLSWGHLIKRDWKVLRKPLIFSLLAGVFLGIYLITWIGALFFVFIFVIYVILQVIIDHLNGKDSFYLGFTGFIIGLIGLLIFMSIAGYTSHKLALIITMILPPALAALSRLMAWRKLKIFYFPAALVVIGVLFIIIFRLIDPTQYNYMVAQLQSVFNPGGPTSDTTMEMQPILFPLGQFTTVYAYGNFTTSFFLFSSNLVLSKIRWIPTVELIPIAFAIWLWIKQRKEQIYKPFYVALGVLLPVIAIAYYFLAPPEWKLRFPGLAIISLLILVVVFIRKRGKDRPMLVFFVWTLVILITTLAQRRFGYYLVVNFVLLSSYLCWLGVSRFSRRQNHEKTPETQGEQYKRSALVGIIGGTLLFCLSFFLSKTIFFFIPAFIVSLLSIFYGFWAWVKLKNKNEYMILWAFVFPIGALALALSKDESIRSVLTKKNKEQPKDKPREKTKPWLYAANMVTLLLLVYVVAFSPNWDKAKVVATAASFAPTDGWEETAHWLRNNTPEPLPAGSYYSIFPTPPSGSFSYPDTAYTVTAWWDYGYMITRTAQRIPSDNPSQEPNAIKNVASLFLSTNQQQERDMVKTLKSAYFVLDSSMTTGVANSSGKLWAVATWSGKADYDFTSVFYLVKNKEVYQIRAYDLDYYKTLCVRLYNFDGKSSTSETPVVITYEIRTDSASGNKYYLCTEDPQEFDSYQEALNYVNNHPDKTYYIGGSSPFINPMPMEAVEDYQLVFGSSEEMKTSDTTSTSTTKVFEYVGPK